MSTYPPSMLPPPRRTLCVLPQRGGTKSSYDNLANLRNPFGTVSKIQPAVNARRRHNRKHTKHQKNTAHGNRLNPFTDLIYTVIYIHSCDTPSQPRCMLKSRMKSVIHLKSPVQLHAYVNASQTQCLPLESPKLYTTET